MPRRITRRQQTEGSVTQELKQTNTVLADPFYVAGVDRTAGNSLGDIATALGVVQQAVDPIIDEEKQKVEREEIEKGKAYAREARLKGIKNAFSEVEGKGHLPKGVTQHFMIGYDLIDAEMNATDMRSEMRLAIQGVSDDPDATLDDLNDVLQPIRETYAQTGAERGSTWLAEFAEHGSRIDGEMQSAFLQRNIKAVEEQSRQNVRNVIGQSIFETAIKAGTVDLPEATKAMDASVMERLGNITVTPAELNHATANAYVDVVKRLEREHPDGGSEDLIDDILDMFDSHQSGTGPLVNTSIGSAAMDEIERFRMSRLGVREATRRRLRDEGETLVNDLIATWDGESSARLVEEAHELSIKHHLPFDQVRARLELFVKRSSAPVYDSVNQDKLQGFREELARKSWTGEEADKEWESVAPFMEPEERVETLAYITDLKDVDKTLSKFPRSALVLSDAKAMIDSISNNYITDIAGDANDMGFRINEIGNRPLFKQEYLQKFKAELQALSQGGPLTEALVDEARDKANDWAEKNVSKFVEVPRVVKEEARKRAQDAEQRFREEEGLPADILSSNGTKPLTGDHTATGYYDKPAEEVIDARSSFLVDELRSVRVRMDNLRDSSSTPVGFDMAGASLIVDANQFDNLRREEKRVEAEIEQLQHIKRKGIREHVTYLKSQYDNRKGRLETILNIEAKGSGPSSPQVRKLKSELAAQREAFKGEIDRYVQVFPHDFPSIHTGDVEEVPEDASFKKTMFFQSMNSFKEQAEELDEFRKAKHERETNGEIVSEEESDAVEEVTLPRLQQIYDKFNLITEEEQTKFIQSQKMLMRLYVPE